MWPTTEAPTTSAARLPASIKSWPRPGPTVRSSTIVSLAGNAPGAEQDREIVGLVDREIAGDLACAAGDRRTDDRRRDDLAVEHDRERAADAIGRDPPEPLRPPEIEFEGYVRLAGLLVEALLGVDQVRAVDHDPLLHGDRPAALLHRQAFHLVRRIAGIGRQLEV